MRGFGRITLIASAILAALLATPSSASACDFEEPPPPQEALEDARAVFSGEVTSIETVDDDPGGQYVAATIDVARAWKGIDASPVVVETHQDQGTCGFPFEQGESYIVYAYGNGTPLTTALYHRTQELDRADEDLEVLGEGSEVEEETTTSDNDDFNPAILLIGAVILSVVLAGVLMLRQHMPGLSETADTDDDYDAGNDDPASRRL